MIGENKERQFEQMLKFALLNKNQKHKHEMHKWEEKAKGKYREHQF
jgi:hypothetical protein